MRATCSEPTCGKTFEAKRSTARFCGSNCRVKAARRRATEPETAPADAPQTVLDVPLLVAATIDELAKADRLGTALGQAALVLAEKACNRHDTGSATASVIRQLQATLSAALAGAESSSDPLDELDARRRAKASGA